MRFGAAAGRDGEELHVEVLGADRLRRDGGGVHETLLALVGLGGLDELAGDFGGGHGASFTTEHGKS